MVTGVVTYLETEYTDTCILDTVKEYYCDTGLLGVLLMTCQGDCYDGACIPFDNPGSMTTSE